MEKVRQILCEARDTWTGKCVKDCCYKEDCDKLLTDLRKIVYSAVAEKDEHWKKDFVGDKKFAMGWNCSSEKTLSNLKGAFENE